MGGLIRRLVELCQLAAYILIVTVVVVVGIIGESRSGFLSGTVVRRSRSTGYADVHGVRIVDVQGVGDPGPRCLETKAAAGYGNSHADSHLYGHVDYLGDYRRFFRRRGIGVDIEIQCARQLRLDRRRSECRTPSATAGPRSTASAYAEVFDVPVWNLRPNLLRRHHGNRRRSPRPGTAKNSPEKTGYTIFDDLLHISTNK